MDDQLVEGVSGGITGRSRAVAQDLAKPTLSAFMPHMPPSTTTPLISVVVPVYNEASHLEASLGTIGLEIAKVTESYEIIVVNDGSRDGTWNVVTAISSIDPRIIGLNFSRNFGKEAAIRAGLDASTGDAIITIDADLQHPPALIPEMVDLWRSGSAHVVDAIKVSRGDESFRARMHAKLFYAIFNRLSGYDLRGASDFKLMDRCVVNALLKMPEYNLFYRGMANWLGFRRKEVHFSVAPRVDGKSGWSFIKLIQLALTAVTAFSSFPLHFVTLVGVIFGGFAVVLAAQTLGSRLSGTTVPGYSTVVFLLLILGSTILIGMGILGAYISRIFDEVKGRPRYLIAETTSSRDES